MNQPIANTPKPGPTTAPAAPPPSERPPADTSLEVGSPKAPAPAGPRVMEQQQSWFGRLVPDAIEDAVGDFATGVTGLVDDAIDVGRGLVDSAVDGGRELWRDVKDQFRLPLKETGHDQVGRVGTPTTLSTKLELDGPSYADWDLKDKEVEFFVNGQSVGVGRTDRDGVARVPFTPTATGQLEVTYQLAEADDRARFKDDDGQGTLFVLDDRPAVIVDIDGTLSTMGELKVPFFGEKAESFDHSVEALNRLSSDYNIIYLTARDDAFDHKTRQFLTKDHDGETQEIQAFPDGPVFYNDMGLTSYSELAQLDKDRHAAFKTETIKDIQLAGIPVVAGIGNAETDRLAYQATHLDTFILDPEREDRDPGSFYRQIEATFTNPARLADYQERVGEVIANRDLPAGSDAALQRDLDILTGTKATTGNTLQALIDGDQARPEILGAIQSAERDVTYHTFEFHDDPAGREIAQTLMDKAQEGVAVRVSLDAIGSKHLPPFKTNPLVEEMRAAGVDVEVYNPVELSNLDDVLHRDHRKVITIDGGELSLIGGMNTGFDYLGGEDQPPPYRDLFLKVEGPAARDIHQGVRPETTPDVPGADPTPGEPSVRIVFHRPKEDFHIKDAYLRLIAEADEKVNLVNSFPMDRDIIDAMVDAAKRGVEVNYLYGRQDAEGGAIDLVMENKFPELLTAGVNIYRHPDYIHAKSLSVDGEYATVGSSNVDNFALELNHESIAIVSDPAWVEEFDSQFGDHYKEVGEKVPSDRNDPFWKDAAKGALLDKLWPDWLE